ncbi:Golgi-associated plant pathogenesis-related protein 1-like [Toxorhynchites rutilus septentrionalis]|uniref:Golgi-associated plant pathogenesis-related protein 1-like n=1 Tax=Toxorhynchites rutilus septentrionalis TaxID=329112 RepID=UPI0024788F38|nr:Golgi-associated plant pathogenesis-related protein 1-like [Toxorhynchites rutilus septentrionalis]
MSYTRKVTVIRQGCSGSYSERTVTESTSSVSSGSGFSSLSWFKKNSTPLVTIDNETPKRATSTVTVTKNAPTKAQQFNRSAGGGSSSSSSFESAVLDAHNRLRARHSAPLLTLNASISQYAQEWANNLARRGTLQHRTSDQYGENLYACFGKTELTGEEVVQSWYSEIKHYRYGQSSPSNFSQVGHFTQVVWKGSRELGVGMAQNGNQIYVVCNYDPPGNVLGRYSANVSSG